MRWQLIDKILTCEPGVEAVGQKCFSADEEFFKDHFPGMPIVPGVLQIEMMAQMAGKCVAMAKSGVLPVLGAVKSSKFYRNVNPGDVCKIAVKITKISSQYALAEGDVLVNEQKASSASILFGFVDRNKLTSNDFDAVTQDFLKSRAGNL